MTYDAFKAGQVDLELLRDLYRRDPIAKRLFRDLAQRQRNYAEIKVNRTAQRVGASRREVIRLFRKLQEAGCGQFIVGRGGWPSRFVWDVEMVEVGRGAGGEDAPINAVDPSAPPEPEDDERPDRPSDSAANSLLHTFQLRPDLKVMLELPTDLTPVEAGRLADFLRALPFGAS